MLQRAEMVRRIAEEIEGYVVELGADGRLVMLQLEELIGGVEDDRRLVAKDYFQAAPDFELLDVMRVLGELDDDELLDLHDVASVLHLRPGIGIDTRAAAARVPPAAQDPAPARDRVRPRGRPLPNLQKIMRAGIADLTEVEGVGDARARAIKEGLSRLAETSILERYV